MTNTERSGLNCAIDVRQIGLQWLCDRASPNQFSRVVENIKTGAVTATANGFWLGFGFRCEPCTSERVELTPAEWCDFALKVPNTPDDRQVHLIDQEHERAFVDIKLKGSQVNRTLGLTTQGGGQPPKMSPKIFALLAAMDSKGKLPSDDDEVLAILEGEEYLWESSGVISGPRGLRAIAEFRRYLRKFKALPNEAFDF